MARTRESLGGMRLTRFVPEPRRRAGLARLDQARVLLLEDRDDVGHGHVVPRAALEHILHVTPPRAVVRLEDGVLPPVELQRDDTEALAQRAVERRRGLDPAAVQIG